MNITEKSEAARKVGRPSTTEKYIALISAMLRRDPRAATTVVAAAVERAGYRGGRSALYERVGRVRAVLEGRTGRHTGPRPYTGATFTGPEPFYGALDELFGELRRSVLAALEERTRLRLSMAAPRSGRRRRRP